MFNDKYGKWAIFFIALSISLLNGCGGGSSAAPPSAANPITFTGSAAAGELVTYTMDTTNLTYSYTIVESQYGLTGKTGSGTLVANGDGSYSLSGITNSKAVIFQNGMLIAAIHDTFNGITKTVPIFGISNQLTTLAAAAATYNYESYQCPTLSCSTTPASTFYGTFQINSNGTFVACKGADYATNPAACVGGASTGTLNSLGAGKWQVVNATGNTVGTALAYTAANGQNVVLIDLKDPLSYGYGMVVGSSQAAITASDVNGTWVAVAYGESNGIPSSGYETLTVTGGNSRSITNLVLDGVAQANSTSTFTLNSPWNGMIQNNAGGNPSVFAGTGMFANVASSGTGSAIVLGFKM